MMVTRESALETVQKEQIRFIDLWFTDIMGMVKTINVPARRLESVLDHGTHFDGSAVDGFARVAESDMLLMPDINTFAVLPNQGHEGRTARMICSVYTPQGEPFIGDPRAALRRVLDRAAEMGFVFKTGIEMEFFLFKTCEDHRPRIDAPYDDASYFDMTSTFAQSIRWDIMESLESVGISLNSMHSEIGPGQHEIDLDYDDALVMADRLLTARVVLKTVAQQRGLHCTFMPRPRADLAGSGMHTHQSLHEQASGRNLFSDEGHEYGLSEIARQFLAGQLCHARAMSAVLAPLVNSYKRLGTSFEAPTYVSWAHINRSALIRVPSITPSTVEHTRLELRCPDPSTNPYLATAVMLQAGLDGIKHRMPLPEPLEETLLSHKRSRMRQVEALPATLGEALEALSQNDVILSALGPYIADRYVDAKRQEFDEYNRYISEWELERYLNRY
jgi:glutamine synthetase